MVTHYLYFATRSVASAAAYDLERAGFSTQVRESATGEQWLVLAKKESSSGQVDDLQALERFASRFDGEYDGFETEAPVE